MEAIGKMEIRETGLVVVIIAWITGSMLLLLSMIYLILNLKLRNTRIIKMSSPNLNLVIAAGGILASITSILYGVEYFLTDSKNIVANICQLRVALITCSFSLLYGPLLAKSWRVNKIFEEASLKRVVIRDSKLLLFVVGLLMCDFLVMTIWQIIDPVGYKPKASISQIIEDTDSLPEIPVVLIYTCTSSYIGTWVTLILLCKLPVLIASLILAWKTRDVMLPSMNDSHAIISSTIITMFTAAVVLVIGAMYQSNPDVVYSATVLGIGICTAVTLSMAFIPKFILWWRNPEKSALRLSLNFKSTHSVTGINNTTDPFDDDMFTMVAENISMKKSLQEKDTAITNLQSHLNNAQSKLMELSLDQDTCTRVDSGIDIDISSNIGDSQNDLPSRMPIPRSPNVLSISHNEKSSPKISLKSYQSSSSFEEFHKLCRLRDSIAEDLTLATKLSGTLRNSLSRDIHAVSRKTSLKYDSVQSRADLAGSIAKSYDLKEDTDTYSYISNCVTSTSNLRQFHKTQYPSSDSLTIPNDKLYPDYPNRNKAKHLKSDLNRTVYVIPTNQPQKNLTLIDTIGTDTFV